ncbi:hypothetical protein ACFY15_00740 [Streptomyces sp. NPDC001373]|uniref:hypothetical protein n=1 Tax=Streptomyces sp. NPDC001373 TaxID=3364565 RepID=UPI0036C9A000
MAKLPLPRRTPANQPTKSEPAERIPWDAFAAGADVTAAYGQPSPALVERARRGWRRLGSMHERLSRAGEDGAQ